LLVQFNHKVSSLLWGVKIKATANSKLDDNQGSDKPWSPHISDGVPCQKKSFTLATNIDVLSE